MTFNKELNLNVEIVLDAYATFFYPSIYYYEIYDKNTIESLQYLLSFTLSVTMKVITICSSRAG